MKSDKINIKRIIAVVILLSIITSNLLNNKIIQASTNQWITEDFSLPAALSGSTVEYSNGKMYVIGGFKNGTELVDTVHIYDFVTKSWSLGATLPNKTAFAQSILVGDKIYYMGGHRSTNGKFTSTNEMVIYHITTNQWTKGTNLPNATATGKAIEYQGKIYIFGGLHALDGTVTNYYKTIQIYDIERNTWTSDPSMSFARYGYSLELINENVYLIGGHNGSVYFNDVKIYNLISKTWTEGKAMDNARCHVKSVNYNNKIYVMGGNVPSVTLNTVQIYDTVTDTWSSCVPINEAKRYFGAVIHNENIYIIGGETVISPITNTNKIESLQLPPSDNRIFAHIYIGEKTQLSFTHNLTDNQNHTWKSSSPDIATVDSNGMVTAMKEGTTFISTYNQDGSFLEYIPVIVTENDVYRMAIHLNMGEKHKLYLRENPSNITWFSMDNSVAAVSANGKVTGVEKGLAIVKAELDGMEYYIYVRVND